MAGNKRQSGFSKAIHPCYEWRSTVQRRFSMADIHIQTDNPATAKIYIGNMAGAAAAKVEAAMQKTVRKVITNTAGFTLKTEQSKIGYTINLAVTKIETGALSIKCFLSGFIERYPPKPNIDGKKGQELVGLNLTGNGKVNGTSEGDMLFCVESAVETMVVKSCIPTMSKDMANRP